MRYIILLAALIILFSLNCGITDSNYGTVKIDGPYQSDFFDADVYWDGKYKGSLYNSNDEINIKEVSKCEHVIKCYIYNIPEHVIPTGSYWVEETYNVKDYLHLIIGPYGIVKM